MVSETHDNVDLVLGVKLFNELKAEMSTRKLKFNFMNWSVPVFPANKEMVKPKERVFLKVEAQFADEISGLG